MVEKKWLKSRVQLLLCVSYYFRMVSFCETLDFYEIILSNHASDPWSVRYLPTSLKIRYIHLPAEILFVTMHFSLLASRTFQRELAWIAFSLGKEAKVAVLFHLGFHGCEYGWCLVALRVCNQPQNFCLFPKAIQDVCDRAPSWTLAVYSLTSLSSLPNPWSGSLRMCLHQGFPWLNNTLLKQISHYPHLLCFVSHHGSVLGSQICSRWNESGKCSPGAYLMYCITKGSMKNSRQWENGPESHSYPGNGYVQRRMSILQGSAVSLH